MTDRRFNRHYVSICNRFEIRDKNIFPLTSGGTCALVGCAIIKPRMGRFDNNGKVIDMPGHSVPMAALGGFILLFGFLAFNGGSQVRVA